MKKLLLLIGFVSVNIFLKSQNIQFVINQNWENYNWQNSSKQSFSYDINGYLAVCLYQSWSKSDSTWKNYEKDDNINNSNGLVQQKTNLNWDTINNLWKNSRKSTYNYNGNKINSETHQIWINNSWKNSMKLSYNYNNGYVGNILYESWNSTNNTWRNSEKMDITNDSAGNILFYIHQKWDTLSNSWNNIAKTNNLYVNNLIQETLVQYWINNNWENMTKMTCGYDSLGYQINLLQEYWDNSNGIWKSNWLTTYTNSPNGIPQQQLLQSWNLSTSSWKNYSRAIFNYVNSTTEIYEHISLNVSVYPNPTNGVISVSCNNLFNASSVSLYSLDGKKIIERNNISGNTYMLDISEQPSGIYFIEVNDGENIFRNKIIKN